MRIDELDLYTGLRGKVCTLYFIPHSSQFFFVVHFPLRPARVKAVSEALLVTIARLPPTSGRVAYAPQAGAVTFLARSAYGSPALALAPQSVCYQGRFYWAQYSRYAISADIAISILWLAFLSQPEQKLPRKSSREGSISREAFFTQYVHFVLAHLASARDGLEGCDQNHREKN